MKARRLVAPLVVVAAVAGGAVAGAIIGVPGLSSAQTSAPSSTTTTPSGTHDKGAPGERVGGAVFDAAAKALGLTTDQLKAKLADGKTTIADVAAAQHVDINKVIDAMTAVAHDRIKDLVNQPWPTGGAKHAMGPAPAAGAFGILGRGIDINAIAKALGTDPATLKQDLMSGKSIADIAKANGVDLNKAIDQIVADATAKIDQAVKDGKLTQAQADKIESMLKDTITKLANGNFKLPFFGGEKGHFGFGGGHGGPNGSGSAPTTVAPSA